jgi:hypothetical protein
MSPLQPCHFYSLNLQRADRRAPDYGSAARIRGGAAIGRLVTTTISARRSAPAWTPEDDSCNQTARRLTSIIEPYLVFENSNILHRICSLGEPFRLNHGHP